MSLAEMSFFQKVVHIAQTNASVFLGGAANTMIVAIVCTLLGCVIGFAVGIVQTIPVRREDHPVKKGFLGAVRFLLSAYVEIFRGTPMIVQSVFIFYGYAMVTGNPMGIWPAAILIVSVNTGAYMAETVRGGIMSIDPGQTEGAKAIGMTHFQTMLYVIFPQTLRNIMPQIGNNLIINIKDSSVLFIIGFMELFYRGKSATGVNYQYFATYTIVMVLYFIMTFFVSRLLRLWERKLDGPANYDLATTDTLAHTSGMASYQSPKHSSTNLDLREVEK